MEGKALIAKGADNDSFLPGYWEQVGGKADPGETQEEAAILEHNYLGMAFFIVTN